MSAQIDRDKIVEDLGQVFDFLHSIDDPYADSVAVAAGIISGEIGEAPAAARLLTLEEVRGWKGCLWVEEAAPYTVNHRVRFSRGAVAGEEDGNLCFAISKTYGGLTECNMAYYGVSIRCWADKPTEEERAGTPWEVL